MYEDFKVKFQIDRPENTNLIFSPDADFRRKQVIKFQQAGYSSNEAYNYGRHIGSNANSKRGQNNHQARFP